MLRESVMRRIGTSPKESDVIHILQHAHGDPTSQWRWFIIVDKPVRRWSLIHSSMEEQKILCLFSRFGCRQSVTLETLENHERICRCKPCKCPIARDGCEWMDRLLKLRNHLLDVHHFSFSDGFDVVLNVSVRHDASDKYYVLNRCMRRDFVIMVEKRIAREANDIFDVYYVYILMIAPRAESETYAFRATQERGDQRFTWEGIPIPIEEHDFCNPSFVLHELCVQPFITENIFTMTVGLYKP